MIWFFVYSASHMESTVYLQVNHFGVIVSLSDQGQQHGNWYKLDNNNQSTETRMGLCTAVNQTRICRGQKGYDENDILEFHNVTVEDHATRYIFKRENEMSSVAHQYIVSVYGEVLTEVPIDHHLMTSSNLRGWSLVSGSAGEISKSNGFYYKRLKEQAIRIRCGVLASIRPFDIVWSKITDQESIEIENMSSLTWLCSGLDKTFLKPFSMSGLAWRRESEMWSDLFVPVRWIAEWSGHYVCRVRWTDIVDGPESIARRVAVSRGN